MPGSSLPRMDSFVVGFVRRRVLIALSARARARRRAVDREGGSHVFSMLTENKTLLPMCSSVLNYSFFFCRVFSDSEHVICQVMLVVCLFW